VVVATTDLRDLNVKAANFWNRVRYFIFANAQLAEVVI
jgi:hypothetical protein